MYPDSSGSRTKPPPPPLLLLGAIWPGAVHPRDSPWIHSGAVHQYPSERSNLLPLMWSGPACPDKLRQSKNYSNSAQYFKMQIRSWTLHCWAILQDWHGKAPNRSKKEWPIMKCEEFCIIQSLWAEALETEKSCFSKVILASNVTPNITREADSLRGPYGGN